MSYGSLELKRSYQRNLGFSVILSGLFYIVVIVGISAFIGSQTTTGESIRSWSLVELTTPPIMVIKDEPTGCPVVEGYPVPVPKAQDMKVQIGTHPYRGEVYGIVPDLDLLNVAGSCDDRWIEVKSLLTQKMKLVETDRLPECFHVILPKYPDSARANGIESDVFVLVLIDQKGKVREVIAKPSRPGWGFAEATVHVVGEWQYHPAISNNEKVAVQVPYKLRFKLKVEG